MDSLILTALVTHVTYHYKPIQYVTPVTFSITPVTGKNPLHKSHFVLVLFSAEVCLVKITQPTSNLWFTFSVAIFGEKSSKSGGFKFQIGRKIWRLEISQKKQIWWFLKFKQKIAIIGGFFEILIIWKYSNFWATNIKSSTAKNIICSQTLRNAPKTLTNAISFGDFFLVIFGIILGFLFKNLWQHWFAFTWKNNSQKRRKWNLHFF